MSGSYFSDSMNCRMFKQKKKQINFKTFFFIPISKKSQRHIISEMWNNDIITWTVPIKEAISVTEACRLCFFYCRTMKGIMLRGCLHNKQDFIFFSTRKKKSYGNLWREKLFCHLNTDVCGGSGRQWQHNTHYGN